jgi:glycosyltransferase involved in cell wall biosynthesis
VTGRIAVLHEWFARFGGSENVALELVDLLHADLHVLYEDEGAVPPVDARETVLSKLGPLRRKQLAVPLTPLAWRTHRTPHYDVVVTSSHALGHTARLPDAWDATYLSYVYTPARYIWLPELDERAGNRALAPARAGLRVIDRRFARHVTSYAADSVEVASRIRRFWHRDSVVIYPPVDTEWFTPAPTSASTTPNGLLSVGRFIGYKRHDFAIAVAEASNTPLVIAGSGPLEADLRRQAAAASVPVEFVISPDQQRLRELYRQAEAFVFAAHEDFGLVPIEAQACGTPVVAYAAGGALETVTDGVVGALVADLDPQQFADRLADVRRLDRADVSRHAQRFSRARFRAEVRDWVRLHAPDAAPEGAS